MVLSVRLSVETENLVEVKGALCEIIDFERSSERNVRIADPHASGVHDFCWEVQMHPLCEISVSHKDLDIGTLTSPYPH